MEGIILKGLKGLNGLEGLIKDNKHLNTSKSENYFMAKTDQLVPGRFQPRTSFNHNDLSELAESIKYQGIIQPIIVRALDVSTFEIIAGERRWRAAQLAGLTEVPVVKRDISDETALAFGLIENIQRKDLNPIDQAKALQKLIDDFSITHEQVAKIVGKSRTTITNLIRLLTLPEEIKSYLVDSKLEIGHAKVLVSVNAEQGLKLAHEVVKKNLTVRQLEMLVYKINQSNTTDPHKSETPKWIQEILNKLTVNKLNGNIVTDNKSYKISFNFRSKDELEKFCTKILS